MSAPRTADAKATAVLELFHAGLWTIPNWWPLSGGRCACADSTCESPGKHPCLTSWKPYQTKRPTEQNVRSWLRQFPLANWGIALGEAAGVIVVDFDGVGAETLLLEAGVELPACASWRSPGGAKVLLKHPGGRLQKKIRLLVGNGCAVDLLADGSQVVMPPSRHRQGVYEWVTPLREGIPPAPSALLALARQTRADNGNTHHAATPGDPIPKGQRNATLTSLAGTMRRRGMSPEAILAALREENKRCEPPLPDAELREIARSVGRYEPAPERPSETPPLILDPADPLPSARAFVAQSYMVNGLPTLRHYGGVFFAHEAGRSAYAERDEAAIHAELYTFLERAQQHITKGHPPTVTLAPFKPTKSRMENVLDALRAVTNLPTSYAAPCWLREDPGLDPLDILACQNGLLHIPTRTVIPASPAFFNLTGLPFAYDPEARAPVRWLQFLNELWPEDSECRDTLQEIIGYTLTPRTHYQKVFMLVGPKRSGKGTIGRIVRRLLGERNVCGPALANMAEQFGPSILIGKSLAIIADARISGRADSAVFTERLLSISGEDMLSIPRKYLPDWTGTLSTRFLLLTNELPKIEDASGALASRFIVLTLSQSFYGREDHALFERFLPEIPGILNWALDGWDRLTARGRFVQPRTSAGLIQQFEDLGSPVSAFVRERCEIGSGYEVAQASLFSAWKDWCEANGRERSGTTQTLGRNLRAAFPWLDDTQPRVDGARVRCWVGLRLKVQ